MKSVAVSDASTLIILSHLGQFSLLTNLFDKILVPRRVVDEISLKQDGVCNDIWRGKHFEISECNDEALIHLLDGLLDYGESEAIAIAKNRGVVLLIDEKKGRKIALNMGIRIVGFLGILRLNHHGGHLQKNEIEAILLETKKLGFRLSAKLEQQFFSLL